jgi:multicomponent Na+:H+ antiporter subunit D
MKGALFMALGCIAIRFGTSDISVFRGLGRRMPWTMAAFVAGGLSLIGVPLTVGFISKWYLVLAAIELGWWPIVAVIIIGSLLAVVYIWRVVEIAYLQPPEDETRCEAPLSMLVPTWVLVLANFWLGIDTRLTVGIAERAAAMLSGLSP